MGALENASSRATLSVSDNAVVSGFIIAGDEPKTVILRAIGPSLEQSGVAGAVSDTTLELHEAAGGLIASNDNWRDSQEATFAKGGAYHPLQPASELESALAITLPPGSYTTVVSGKDGAAGVVLAEIYDSSRNANSRIVNVSTRALVQTGENVLIGGFVAAGDAETSLILRALGPSLSQSGISNGLADPMLELYDGNGSLIGYNDNWSDDPVQAESFGQLAPSSDRESAIAVRVGAGNYTAIVRGKNGSSGVALLEIYNSQ